MREALRNVIGVRGLLKIRQVATYAVGGSALEPSSCMARVAVERRMGSHQREACDPEMVELGSEPVIHAVALLAGSRKAATHVTRLGSLVVFRVTGIALRGKSLKLAYCGAFMA